MSRVGSVVVPFKSRKKTKVRGIDSDGHWLSSRVFYEGQSTEQQAVWETYGWCPVSKFHPGTLTPSWPSTTLMPNLSSPCCLLCWPLSRPFPCARRFIPKLRSLEDKRPVLDQPCHPRVMTTPTPEAAGMCKAAATCVLYLAPGKKWLR